MKNLGTALIALVVVAMITATLLLLYVAFGALSMEWNLQMKVKLAAKQAEANIESGSVECPDTPTIRIMPRPHPELQLPPGLQLPPVYEGPMVPPYMDRAEGDARERKPLVASVDACLLWLNDRAFFEPNAIHGVQPRVVEAKKRLGELFASGHITRRLSPTQIAAIAVRESQFWNLKDQNGLYIDLNCLGDLGYAGDNKAHGPLQISKRAHESVAAIDGLGLRSTDFLGDLALSEMVFQAWVDQWLPKQGSPELTFEWASRYWNGGPTGSRGENFSKALRYWNGSSDRAGVKGFYAQVTQLPITKQLADFLNEGGVLQGGGVVVVIAPLPQEPELPDPNGMLPDFWRHPWYGTPPENGGVLFPDACVSWAKEQFLLP